MKSIFIRYSLALVVVIFSSLSLVFLMPLTLYFSYFLLNLFYNPTIIDSTIIINSFSFTIISACTALLAFVLLTELILFTRDIKLKLRIKLFITGFILIFLMNILRIFLLIFIYINFGKDYFNAIHLIYWHVISTIFVAIVWIFLVEYYKIKSIPLYDDINLLIDYLEKR